MLAPSHINPVNLDLTDEISEVPGEAPVWLVIAVFAAILAIVGGLAVTQVLSDPIESQKLPFWSSAEAASSDAQNKRFMERPPEQSWLVVPASL